MTYRRWYGAKPAVLPAVWSIRLEHALAAIAVTAATATTTAVVLVVMPEATHGDQERRIKRKLLDRWNRRVDAWLIWTWQSLPSSRSSLDSNPLSSRCKSVRLLLPLTFCEEAPRPPKSVDADSSSSRATDASTDARLSTASTSSTSDPSSNWQNQLYRLLVSPLLLFAASNPPLPRRLVRHDPIWTLTNAQLQQRKRNEEQAHKLLKRIVSLTQGQQQQPQQQQSLSEQQQQELAKLQAQWLETVYGPNITLRDRQAFLERYGCTGWTDEVLHYLVHDLNSMLETNEAASTLEPKSPPASSDTPRRPPHRGFVEIGAGNGQWARALTDYYTANTNEKAPPSTQQKFDLVLAYDNFSALPLRNTAVYHPARSTVARDYFFPVRALLQRSYKDNSDSMRANETRHSSHATDSIAATLQQWSCRGRILLLVYPPPDSNMALTSLQAYDQVNQNISSTISRKNVLVYVGEGRGGANANDAFFDYLEDPHNDWMLVHVMNVQSFGSKGYEKLFVFKRQSSS